MNECYLSEIYSAIQGEGPLVGVKQIFVRFSGCDLRCTWCDTSRSLVREKFCEVENIVNSRSFQKVKNPITNDKLIEYINNLQPELHHSVSITGGEPLLQHKFLLTFLPQLKLKTSLPIYLESGGHRPNELKNIISFIDYVSMDFKLPTSAKTGTLWNNHRDFLAISVAAKKNVWVKIVITADTSYDDLVASVNLIKSINNNGSKIEIFLQPVTEMNDSKPPGENDLLKIHSELLKLYPNVRVVPQVHKLIGQK